MARRFVNREITRRDLIRLSGAATAGAAIPVFPRHAVAALPQNSQDAGGNAGVVFGREPFANWTGFRFWSSTGVPSRLQWEPLMDLDEALMPAEGLAESWEQVSGTLSRYQLRDGLTWSDGTPLTAEDVVFSMNLTFHPDVANLMASEISTIAGGDAVKSGEAETLSGVRAVDERTIEIETTIPDVSVLRTLALRWWAPIPKHIFENVNPAELLSAPEMVQPTVVSGPFKIDRIETDKWYEMSANATYWREGKPELDNLTYIIGNIGDPVALASQERFDYYVIQNQPDVGAAIADNENYDVTFVDYIQPYRIQFNTALPQFQDPRFRKAVAYAIDRETLSEQIYQGFATPSYTDFVDELLDPDAEVYSYDPEKARQLLSEANWDTSQTVYFEDVATPAGETADPIEEAEFAAYQQWLGDVGIKLERRLHPDNATFNDFVRPAGENPEFHAYQNPHRRYDLYGPLEMKVYLASEPFNYAYWQNAKANALVEQAVAEPDYEAYVAIARQLSILVAEECPYIPTKAVKSSIVVHNDFSGETPIGEWYFGHMRPYDWTVER